MRNNHLEGYENDTERELDEGLSSAMQTVKWLGGYAVEMCRNLQSCHTALASHLMCCSVACARLQLTGLLSYTHGTLTL